jgi:mannose-6-phosphate isomerase
MLKPFKLIPEYRDYVWGGNRLRPDAKITAEAWVIYANDLVADGPYAGKSLADVAASAGPNLLGTKAVAQTGKRFPLLIKLLDCAQWLSLQVHPNDAQAQQLEGPGFFGKTEAWYVVTAEDDAQLLGGFYPGVTSTEMEAAVREGGIMDIVQRHEVATGDAIFIAPGMLHALGPGMLIYEVQQTSDITYRVYDWDRPLTSGRKLHLDQAVTVLDPDLHGELISAPPNLEAAQCKSLVSSMYFKLDLIAGTSGKLALDTLGESFSALTNLDHAVLVTGIDWQIDIEQYQSLVIPASCGEFQIELSGNSRVLHAYVP